VNFKDKVNLYRRYPYWATKRCIFVHVPRVAGTSINRALYGRTLGHYSAADIRRRFPDLYERSFVFAFVRNPWDRVLSAYRFAVRGRTESMGMRNPIQYQIREFETFERFLFEWLAKRDTCKSDFVFQPQHIFVLDSRGEQIVDFVGRFESLSADINYVESCLECSLDVAHCNRAGEVGAYRDAYTSKSMIEVVQRIYQQDIQQFNYVF